MVDAGGTLREDGMLLAGQRGFLLLRVADEHGNPVRAETDAAARMLAHGGVIPSRMVHAARVCLVPDAGEIVAQYGAARFASPDTSTAPASPAAAAAGALADGVVECSLAPHTDGTSLLACFLTARAGTYRSLPLSAFR